MPYEPKPLAFAPSRLNGLSEKLIVSHWENHYGEAVQRLNAIEQRLAELNWAQPVRRRKIKRWKPKATPAARRPKK